MKFVTKRSDLESAEKGESNTQIYGKLAGKRSMISIAMKKHNMGFDKTTKRKAGSVHYLNDDATD